jgi:tetratricopeptide (TPR) repeat protein
VLFRSKLVEALLTEYGKKTSRYRGQIDAVLQRATADGDGADLGAIFQGLGAGPAAVYTTAWSAKRNPADALTANNLGVALKDMGDYRRAMAVLLYADRLQPDAPLILVNRAWVLYELGDLDGAKPLFDKVALKAPALTSAQTGLGLIAYCRGDKATAEKHFRKALESRMTPAMAAAWRSARGEEKKRESPKTSESPKKDGEFRLPEMPSNASIKAMASAGPMLQNLGENLDNQLKQLMQRKMELSKVVSKQWNRTSQGGPEGIVVYRSLETTEFLFRDIARLVFAEKGRLGEAMKQLQKSMEGTSKRAEARVPDVESDVKKIMDSVKQYEALLAKHEKENAA